MDGFAEGSSTGHRNFRNKPLMNIVDGLMLFSRERLEMTKIPFCLLVKMSS